MATFFGSISPTLTPHPIKRTNQLSSSSQPPPNNSQPPNQTSSSPPPPQQQKLSTNNNYAEPPLKQPQSSSRNVESTDWIASNLTRRFGLGAGLAWAGFLAFGVISEQIKTRLEVSQQDANTRDVEKEEEVVLPNGIRYYELRVGGGAMPRPRELVVVDVKGSVVGSGQVFVDTFEGDKKPLALVIGSRPYSKGICEGIEYVLRSMRGGGKRRVIIPPNLGFGEEGAELGNGVQIPPSSTLEYVIQVDKVSIAPS